MANVGLQKIKIDYAAPQRAEAVEDARPEKQFLSLDTLLKLDMWDRVRLLWSGRLWVSIGMVPDLKFVGAWQSSKINIVPRSWTPRPVTFDGLTPDTSPTDEEVS